MFAIDPQGAVHFAFGRKIPPRRRVPYGWTKAHPKADPRTAPASALTGAAGTDEKYWGKWASLGGGADKKSTSAIDAARIEANDEAAITPPVLLHQIYVPDAGRLPAKDHRVTLVHTDQPSPAHRFFTFVFKWEDWSEFIALFPGVEDPAATVRGGFAMARASHGEIDATASFTVKQIVRFNEEGIKTGANFFTGYTLNTLRTTVAGAVLEHVKLLARRKQTVQRFDAAALAALTVVRDTSPRIPNPNGWRDRGNPRYW